MNVINQELALEKLNAGLPVIFHTDTLPAIGCLPKFSEIIYKTKKRIKNKPLILMGAENMQLQEFVHQSALEDFKNISSKYWPGALTLIIPISERKKSTVTSSDSTIGIRIPNSLMAKSLILKSGPLLTSSANISGIEALTTPEGVSYNLPNIDILGPVPWAKCSGEASTIISWENYGNWKLIRKGKVFVPRVC
tara:strand:- start:128 stop:709 length:582 start_codon:yes stop_codon:yes gene_type:complete